MKNWRKPIMLTLTAEQLSDHIKVAARSGQCFYCDFR